MNGVLRHHAAVRDCSLCRSWLQCLQSSLSLPAVAMLNVYHVITFVRVVHSSRLTYPKRAKLQLFCVTGTGPLIFQSP